MDADANRSFKRLVDAGRPVGEVIAVNTFLVEVKGLQPVNTHSLVVFEDGSKGFVHHILEDRVIISACWLQFSTPIYCLKSARNLSAG
jgi:F0F1-type ATP synthase alpha subunit